MEKIFTNAYGDPIKVGDRFKLGDNIFTIEKLRVIRWAGLIATYRNLDGQIKKTNLSSWVFDGDKNVWINPKRLSSTNE